MSFKPTLHSTEDSLSSALLTAMRSEMNAAAQEFIKKALLDLNDHLNKKAAELVARAAISITSQVGGDGDPVIHVSVTIPTRKT